jgi:hypothetical protein
MRNIQARIEENIEELFGNLNALVEEIALETIARRVQAKRPPGRRKRSVAQQARRHPEQVGALAEELYGAICRCPGETMATLREQVGQPANALALPTTKLLQAGRIKKTGERQFTRYFPVASETKRTRRRKRR